MIQSTFEQLEIAVTDFSRAPLIRDVQESIKRAKKPHVRTLVEFCEDDVIIPEGRYEGFKFRYSRAPYAKAIHAEIDSGYWKRHVATGSVQSGKTFHMLVVLVLYYIFELRQSFIVGLPTMEVAGDKWRKEVLPAIRAQPKFEKFLPMQYRRDRVKDKIESVTFTHGPELKFMSAKGGDERRSGYTAPGGAITEADKMDTASETSREADPVTQIENRFSSYGDDAVIFMECTVSTELGRIWQEYTKVSSMGQLYSPCVHCREYVRPEREHFIGFESASSEREAASISRFHCPACGEEINDKQRRTMQNGLVLVHNGQTVSSDGQRVGDLPETFTCGSRWSAFNNLFWPSTWLGRQEYRRLHAEDEDNAEKEACQFRWVIPYTPIGMEVTHLNANKVRSQQCQYGKSSVPAEAEWVTMGIDLGKRLAHWTVLVWMPNRQGFVSDYGKFDVPSDDIGVERALKISLMDFNDRLLESELGIDQIWVDARYQGGRDRTHMGYPVYEFCREQFEKVEGDQCQKWFPLNGWDMDRQSGRRYSQPKNPTATTKHLGNNFHTDYSATHHVWIQHINVDHWKLQTQRMFTVPEFDKDGTPNPGHLRLYNAIDPNEHISFTKHLASEKHSIERDPVKGDVVKWTQRGSNHWLDSTVYGVCAASFLNASALELDTGNNASHDKSETQDDDEPQAA